MLTLASPAINRALGSVLNPQQLAQFMSSVGQCAQPLQHRAGLSIAPGANTQRLPGGVAQAADGEAARQPNGIPEDWWSSDWYGNSYQNADGRNWWNGGDSSGGTQGYGWNPYQYQGLFPGGGNFYNNYSGNDPYGQSSYGDYIAGGGFWGGGGEYGSYTGGATGVYLLNNFFEAPSNGGYRAGDFISHYYGGPFFDLQTNLNQEMNQYLAQNFYDGNSVNIGGPTNVTEMNTQILNAKEVRTEAVNGVPAAPGPAGPQGQPGNPGGVGVIGLGGFGGGFDPTLINIRLKNLEDKNANIINVINGLSLRTTEADVLTGVTFDANVCDVTPADTEVVRTVELLKPGAGAL